MIINNFTEELGESILPVFILKHVHIEGDKNGFNSKMALSKFKTSIKKMDYDNKNINLEELKNKYIKSNFILEIMKYDTNDKDIIIKILELELEKKILETNCNNKNAIKNKLNAMKKNRNKANENISDDIFKEYTKLKKISNMPLPEPNEILSNPEQYKPLISMILNNKMINQMGINHPYIKYFKLIANKLNIQSTTTTLNDSVCKEKISQIISNKISNNDDDTDEED